MVIEVEKPRGRELGRIKAPLNRTKSCKAGAEDSEVWESLGGMGGRACKYCHSASQTLLPVPDVALPPPQQPSKVVPVASCCLCK